MTNCPENPTIADCGLEAAKWLIANELVLIDTYGLNGSSAHELIVDKKGQRALDNLRVQRIYYEGLTEYADLSCLACEQCVRLTEDLGELSAKIV